jgi:hypothetical protein
MVRHLPDPIPRFPLLILSHRLVPPWLIPTEIYPTTARAQGTAVSVIIWGLANFFGTSTATERKREKPTHLYPPPPPPPPLPLQLTPPTVTLITPILFNNFQFWIYLVFAATNLIAGAWTFLYCPETGGRSFEENIEFFEGAKEQGSWRVSQIAKGKFRSLHYPNPDGAQGETQPLLQRVRDQVQN